jgi:hypothetical protein
MWPLNMLRVRHWILIVCAALLLASYAGILTWGVLEQALERLAAHPAAQESFKGNPLSRGEALVVAFLFLMLTPPAGGAAFGLLAFIAAVLTGILRAIVRAPAVPDWVLSMTAHATIVVALYVGRDWWLPYVHQLVGTIARALLVAMQ